jgi:hypothetical protein
LRRAFATQFGMPPDTFWTDRDFVTGRWMTDPSLAFGAWIEDRLVGSSLGAAWGSLGVFGPISTHPDTWNRGTARLLIPPVLERLKALGSRHIALLTIAESTKHIGLGAIAYQNKAKVYGLLFAAAAETLTTIAADSKHLGADIGVTAVLHTWGQSLDHHPHVHCIVPGGGISPGGDRWVPCRPNFFLAVRVLSRLFRRLFVRGLEALHAAGELQFFNELAGLEDATAFRAHLAPLSEWVVYAKRPFAGPEQVLAYLARYTHRVAISNRRLPH